MKKKFLSITVLAIVISLSSCGSSSSSFESDVRKMANYQCKEKQLQAKDPSDEEAKKELEDLGKEIDAYSKKMEAKYRDKTDDKEMEARARFIMNEAMEKCK
jgi:peptidoglycan hydrolase CwlO-like protein